MQEIIASKNWNYLECIDFAGCKVDDKKWRLFVDNAHLFSNLKVISLCNFCYLLFLIFLTWNSNKIMPYMSNNKKSLSNWYALIRK